MHPDKPNFRSKGLSHLDEEGEFLALVIVSIRQRAKTRLKNHIKSKKSADFRRISTFN